MSDDTTESQAPPNEEIAIPVEDSSADEILDLIANQRRREVLDVLLTHDWLLTTNDIRNEVVEREHGTVITEIPSEEVKKVHISLNHVHIPKLAEDGLINYDSDRGLIEPTEKLSELEPVLSRLS